MRWAKCRPAGRMRVRSPHRRPGRAANCFLANPLQPPCRVTVLLAPVSPGQGTSWVCRRTPHGRQETGGPGIGPLRKRLAEGVGSIGERWKTGLGRKWTGACRRPARGRTAHHRGRTYLGGGARRGQSRRGGAGSAGVILAPPAIDPVTSPPAGCGSAMPRAGWRRRAKRAPRAFHWRPALPSPPARPHWAVVSKRPDGTSSAGPSRAPANERPPFCFLARPLRPQLRSPFCLSAHHLEGGHSHSPCRTPLIDSQADMPLPGRLRQHWPGPPEGTLSTLQYTAGVASPAAAPWDPTPRAAARSHVEAAVRRFDARQDSVTGPGVFVTVVVPGREKSELRRGRSEGQMFRANCTPSRDSTP